MGDAPIDQSDSNRSTFQQKDASAWISFDPGWTGHRKDVRSAAAKSSAAARKATIARKLALNTDCSTAQAQDATRRSKKRRRDQQEASPASTSSTATLYSRRQSEISLTSLASAASPMSSGTASPRLMPAAQKFGPSPLWSEPETLTPAPSTQSSPPTAHAALQRAVSLVLDIDYGLFPEVSSREPTPFGVSRVKSRSINLVHDAIAAHRTDSGTLLAVALMAAWDLVSATGPIVRWKLTEDQKHSDQRSSLTHLRAWYQLAISQNLLYRQDGAASPCVSIVEAMRLSLQCHLPLNAYTEMTWLLDQLPTARLPQQMPSGQQTLTFFTTVGDLLD